MESSLTIKSVDGGETRIVREGTRIALYQRVGVEHVQVVSLSYADLSRTLDWAFASRGYFDGE